MQNEWVGYEATKNAWTANVSTSAQRLVLLCIARYANDKQTSFPSVEKICADTLLNRKTVFKALKELQASGVLVVSKRPQNNSNSYSFASGTSTKNGSTKNGSTEIGIYQKRNVGSTKNGTSVVPNLVHEYKQEERNKREGEGNSKTSYSKLTEKIVSAYNQTTAGYLPKVVALTDKRRKAVRRFIDFYRKQANAVDEQAFLSAVREYFLKATQSEFLTGKNDRGWKADFDFLTNENKALALLEGKYDTKQAYHQPTNMFTVVKPLRPANFEDDFDPDFDLDSFGVAK